MEAYRVSGDEKHGHIYAIKLVAGAIIFSAGMLGGIAPWWLTTKWRERSHEFLSISNAFAGGVFFGSALVHILPEAAEGLASLSEYPIAYLTASIAFFLCFFVEQVITASKLEWTGHSHGEELEMKPIGDDSHHVHNNNNKKKKKKKKGRKKKKLDTGYDTLEEEEGASSSSSSDDMDSMDVGDIYHDDEMDGVSDTSTLLATEEELQSTLWRVSAIILVVVLSIHALTEGFALGVQTSLDGAFVIVFAILSHKAISSFAYGSSLIKAGFSFRTYALMVLVFAIITPIAICAGIIVHVVVDTNKSGDIMTSVVSAACSGTFLYVATIELQSEFETHRLKKMLVTMMGFTVMAILKIWA